MSGELSRVRNQLEEATKTAGDDVRDDLREVAAAFAELESADRAPDHAVLDGHLNELRQLERRADGETAAAIETALETAADYREGLDQA